MLKQKSTKQLGKTDSVLKLRKKMDEYCYVGKQKVVKLLKMLCNIT